MARSLYLAALLLALMSCLYAQPVWSLSAGDDKNVGQDGAQGVSEDAVFRQVPTTDDERNDDDEDDENACSIELENGFEPHNGLKRRCVGKQRKLSWPWGRKNSQGEDIPSTDSLVSAEQQLHIMNLYRISLIQDPTEKAEAEAVEAERRRQQELVLRQIL